MSYRILSCVILYILSVALPLSAQKQGTARLDSLQALVPSMKQDSSGVLLLTELAQAYRNVNPGEGLKYASQALDLARNCEWEKGEGIAHNSIGTLHQNMGNYVAALESFLKALRVAEKINDKKGITDASGNVGNVYWRQKNYSKALEYMSLSLKLAEQQKDKQGMRKALGNIGNVYGDQKKYAEAITYLTRALNLAEELNDKSSIIINLSNRALTYADLKQFNTALKDQFKALAIAEETGNKKSRSIGFGNIGTMYLRMASDTSAIVTDKDQKLEQAVNYLTRGIDGSKELGLQDAVAQFSYSLFEVYALQANYKQALEAYKQYATQKDSIFSTENNEKIAKLESQRELELKDKDLQIAQLAVSKKRNERWFFVGGIVLLLGIMALLYRSYTTQKKTNGLLSTEKLRSDKLLLNILPTEVAEELKEHGGAKARHYDTVTVLFTDFVDFTGRAETLSAAALVEELHECFTAFDAIIERNGLEKIKTVGDAYLAVGGLPVASRDHAINAVLAALEIRQFMNERNRIKDSFQIRIGLNSGPVVAGIVGVKKFAFDIWGDTVNTAARMEQCCEPGRINLSETTYELVSHRFECSFRGEIDAKNKGKLKMYFLEQEGVLEPV